MEDKQHNAIETAEKRGTIDARIRAILDEAGVKRRFAGRRIGAGEAPCVVNLLRLLDEERCSVFIPKGTYRLIGVAKPDETMRHKPNARLRLFDLQSNQNRYNFLMRSVVDVEAKREGDGRWEDDSRCRTYAIIEDGELHHTELEAYLTRRAFELCKAWGLIGSDSAFSERRLYELDVAKLPLIVRTWARPKALGLIDLMKEELALMECGKALNSRKKAFRTAPCGPTENAEDSEEAEGTTPDDEAEIRSVPCVSYELKGFKPDVKLDTSVIEDAEQADIACKRLNKRLAAVRLAKRVIQFAMDSCGNKWFAGIEPADVKRSKGKNDKKEQVLDLAAIDAAYAGLKLRRLTWMGKVKTTRFEECAPDATE